MRSLLLHRLARDEIREAAAYYRSIDSVLAKAMIAEVRVATTRMREHPASGATTRHGIRKMLLLRFPYTLYYEDDSEHVRVLAFAHQKRRPYYWARRR